MPGQPVYFYSGLINIAIGIQVAMEISAGQPSVVYLYATDFDNPVPLFRIETSGFCVQYDLSHV